MVNLCLNFIFVHLLKRGIKFPSLYMGLLVAQMVKNLPIMQKTLVQSLGGEGPLEKGVATHSSILAWRIPWTEEPGRLQSGGSQRVGLHWATNTLTFPFHQLNHFVPQENTDFSSYKEPWNAMIIQNNNKGISIMAEIQAGLRLLDMSINSFWSL